MENTNQDWRDNNLSSDEVDLLESIENGEWESIGNIEARKQNLKNFFKDTENVKNTININLAQDDLDLLIKKSNQYGMNYKDLIEKLVHNFATGNIAL